jgi:mRNA interferase MazF
VVVVSRDALNRNAPIVIVAPLTSRENKKRLYPTQVELRAAETGLAKDSVVLCEQVRAISKNRLTRRLGAVAGPKMTAIGETLKIALDL